MVSSRCSNKKNAFSLSAECARKGTLLLLFIIWGITPLSAHQRDTLGIGGRTYFTENQGQWSAPFLFQAQMHNAAFFAESDCFTIVLRKEPTETHNPHHFHHQLGHQMHAYKVHFVGCSPQVDVSGRNIDIDGGYDNYYYGHDPNRWATHMPHYGTVFYSDLYPGIDLDVQVATHALKTNFYVAPGADVSDISMLYEGADKLYLSNGNLIIRTSVGELVELEPYAYQETDTGRIQIPARYRIVGNTVSFVIDEYNQSLPLIIDPTLHFSTYTGSTADYWGTTATYDFYKNTYTAGLVFQIGYPVSTGAYDTTYNNNADIAIFKFDSSGSQRLYATYLGGTQADMPHSMYVNTFDELVIFGTTGSNDFPVTPNAYDTSFNGGTNLQYEGAFDINFPNGSDIFISRFSSDGTQLQASTYIGGSKNDGLNYFQHYNHTANSIMLGNDSLYFNYGDGARGELITDDLNNIYVGSTTHSYDFPTTEGSIEPHTASRQSGIVFKIDYNLRTLIWSTYLGNSQPTAVYSIDVDTDYNVIACGGTTATGFTTTPGAMQTTYGGGSADGFVSKISYSGDRLMASTFFGSSAYDQLYFVRTGKHNEVYVYGQTKAPGSTMIYNAAYNVPGSGMLVARLLPDLSGRVWSTVFGTPLGRPNLSPTAFAADICNRVYATGWGRDFVDYSGITWNQAGTTNMEVTSDAYQDSTDGMDFYILALNEDASQLDYATFFGEMHGDSIPRGGYDHVDGGTSRFDKMATLYQSVCASCYHNDGFPTTPGAWSNHNLSHNCNNALFRINIHNNFPVAEFVPPAVGCDIPYVVNFTNTSRGTSFHWDFGDGDTSNLRNPQHSYTSPGRYTVRLIAYQENGCRTSDTIERPLWILDSEGPHSYNITTCIDQLHQIGPHPFLGCSYHWSGDPVSDSTVANPYAPQTGQYILDISTPEGCHETDTYNVTYVYLLDTLIVIPPTCPGGNDGRVIAVIPANVADSAHYYWDGIEGDSILTGLSADGRTHTLTITSYRCNLETQFTVPDPPTLQYQVESQPILCTDQCDGWIKVSYDLPNYHVGDTLVDSLCEGSYTIHFSDTAGCPYQVTEEIIRDSSLNHMRAWADDSVLFLTESVRLHVTEVPGATYQWSNGYTLDHPNSPNPLATPVDSIAIYEVTVTDTMGCMWTGKVRLICTEVNCGRPNIFIPNAFSPNNDGVNDRLCFHGTFVLDFYLAIYTRWGEKVFETHDIHSCWDGRYNGNLCMPGVYTYTCHVKCEANKENILKGDITLIR